jgi:predicted DNA-binding transcriptional regulator AlpA
VQFYVPSELLTQDQVADIFQVSPRTVEDWRATGKGPRFIRIGRSVRYRDSDITVYLDDAIIASHREQAARRVTEVA